jgi:B12-binding domain/radical SAM domain protein
VSTSLVFDFSYPGRYALCALGGAAETVDGVSLWFPREIGDLTRTVRERVASGDRVIVAFSFYSPSFPESVARLAALRAAVPEGYLTIAGGVHATAETKQTLEAGFDLVCVGEGERPLIALLRGESVLPGFVSKTVRGPKPALVQLDEFAPFAVRNRRFGPLEITRGCIYACRFCQTPFMSKARFRHRSVENTRHWVREMALVNTRDVRFISPTSLSYGSPDESVNLAAVEALLAACREVMTPSMRLYFGTFPSEVRPEHITPEALKVLKRFVDNDNLIIGGQSGSDDVRKKSNRGHDVEAIERAVRICVEGSFVPNVDFILGLPGESSAEVEQTLALMRRLTAFGARVHGHTFMPLPGTPFRAMAPGDIDEKTKTELDRLRVYGHWEQQIDIARDLAARRSS